LTSVRDWTVCQKEGLTIDNSISVPRVQVLNHAFFLWRVVYSTNDKWLASVTDCSLAKRRRFMVEVSQSAGHRRLSHITLKAAVHGPRTDDVQLWRESRQRCHSLVLDTRRRSRCDYILTGDHLAQMQTIACCCGRSRNSIIR